MSSFMHQGGAGQGDRRVASSPTTQKEGLEPSVHTSPAAQAVAGLLPLVVNTAGPTQPAQPANE